MKGWSDMGEFILLITLINTILYVMMTKFGETLAFLVTMVFVYVILNGNDSANTADDME